MPSFDTPHARSVSLVAGSVAIAAAVGFCFGALSLRPADDTQDARCMRAITAAIESRAATEAAYLRAQAECGDPTGKGGIIQ
jgi:hypothetical protein